MKKLILISALLLCSNGWAKDTGMVCKWTDSCAYMDFDQKGKCSARNKRTIANFVSQQSDIWLLVSINEVSNTGTVYEFNKDKLEWERDLEPKVTQENITWSAHSYGGNFEPGNYSPPFYSASSPRGRNRILSRENLDITIKLCFGGVLSYGHCRHTLFPTAKCELKTVEEIDALAEPFIKKNEEQLEKRKF